MSPGKITHRDFVPSVLDFSLYQAWKRNFIVFNHAFPCDFIEHDYNVMVRLARWPTNFYPFVNNDKAAFQL